MLRRRIKEELEDEIMDFFTVQGGQVVIYDANNGNVKARKECLEKFEAKGVHVIFLGAYAGILLFKSTLTSALESMCDRDDIITANIRSVKLSSPDVSSPEAECKKRR